MADAKFSRRRNNGLYQVETVANPKLDWRLKRQTDCRYDMSDLPELWRNTMAKKEDLPAEQYPLQKTPL